MVAGEGEAVAGEGGIRMNNHADAIKVLSTMTAGKALKLIYEIASTHPKAVVDSHGRIFGKLIDEVILDMARDGCSKIECIKKYREMSGAGLREAKEAVEAIYNFPPMR